MKYKCILLSACAALALCAGAFSSNRSSPLCGALSPWAYLGSVSAAEGQPQYGLIKKVPIGGDGGWDFLCIDGPSRRLYIARSNRVTVVDIDKDVITGEFTGNDAAVGSGTAHGAMAGVHGVCVLSHLNKGFVTSGKDDTVRIFDLKTLKQIGQVKTGPKPDACIYDPASKSVFAFNNGGTTVTIIDPEGDNTRTIELGGAPESAVPDGEGKMFVNLEDKSEVVVVDTKKMVVTNHWPLAPGTEPTGLAIDVAHHRLFSACKNKTMCILDDNTGKLVATLPIGESVDFALFDPDTHNAFSSNGDGTLTVIHETTPDSFEVVQNVETQKGARTMAMDPEKHHIWLATATMSDPPAGTAGDKPKRRTMVPGSLYWLSSAKINGYEKRLVSKFTAYQVCRWLQGCHLEHRCHLNHHQLAC